MSTNSTGDELMNAKLNAGIIETSDVVESEQNTSIPVATVIDVESAGTEENTETKEEEEVSKEEKEEEEKRMEGLNMLANVTCFKMKQIFKLKEHYSDWKYVFFLLEPRCVDIYSKTGEWTYQIRGNRFQAAMMCSYISAPCQMFKRAYFTIHKVVDGEVQEHPCGGLTKFLRASRNKNRWKFIKDQSIAANTFYVDIGSANYSPMFQQDDDERKKIEHKALILASVFLLDALCFHHTRENPRGKIVRPIGHIQHQKTWNQARTEAAIAASSSSS